MMGNKLVEGLSLLTRKTEKICDDIFMLDFRVVNAFMIRLHNGYWLLIDTGLENSEHFIKEAAEVNFGENPPDAILLTHGHFDHVGSLKALTRYWNVSAYIHPEELAFITGQKDYPVPDDNASDGFVAKMSESFPHSSIDIGHFAAVLPENGVVPFAGEWKWIFTPGHSPGHVSFFRESDRILVSGDAISTVKQESLWSVLTQNEDITGPPSYLTEDFDLAKASIETD